MIQRLINTLTEASQHLHKGLSGKQYAKAIENVDVSVLVEETDLLRVKSVEPQLKNDVWIKREDQHPVYSFKLRGTFYKLQKLPQDSQIVSASTGNLAQALALSAAHLGHHARIVMPDTVSENTIDVIKSFGGHVIIHGHSFDAANTCALQLAKKERALFVHPFDDKDLIIGYGTVARELLKQLSNLDAVFIPVGGGALLAGMGTYIKSMAPNVSVIGVEAEESACLAAALRAGAPIDLDYLGGVTGSVSVKRIGKESFRLAQQYCDEVITVSNEAICDSMQDIFVSMRAISEPSGALSLAGIKKWCKSNEKTGLKLAAILSDANLNFNSFYDALCHRDNFIDKNYPLITNNSTSIYRLFEKNRI